MNWNEYKDAKGKTSDFAKKERVTQKAVAEVKDGDGLVVRAAIEEKKQGYIAMIKKQWDSKTGKALDDHKREYSLTELENEKARHDADMARAKEQSDGLKLAIADFKKL